LKSLQWIWPSFEGKKEGIEIPSNSKRIWESQILKEFENLKFFNLGPSSDLMDENWAVKWFSAKWLVSDVA
jgi:hypothetical protein